MGAGGRRGDDDFLNGENGTVMGQWSLFLILINGITEFVFALNQMPLGIYSPILGWH